MRVISKENKALAKYVSTALNSPFDVSEYVSDVDSRRIAIFTAVDVPCRGISTYSTLGMSDIDLNLVYENVPVRVEVLLPLPTVFLEAPNVLAACAFSAMSGQITPRPGAIVPYNVEEYRPGCKLKHTILVYQALWDLEVQEFPSKKVVWFQAIPISDAEGDYAVENGVDALEDIFEQHDIDVFNLDRPSVL